MLLFSKYEHLQILQFFTFYATPQKPSGSYSARFGAYLVEKRVYLV